MNSKLGQKLQEACVTWKHVVIAMPFMLGALAGIGLWVISQAEARAEAVVRPATVKLDEAKATMAETVTTLRADVAAVSTKIDTLQTLLMTGQVTSWRPAPAPAPPPPRTVPASAAAPPGGL